MLREVRIGGARILADRDDIAKSFRTDRCEKPSTEEHMRMNSYRPNPTAPKRNPDSAMPSSFRGR
ncbi:hypothetical protein GCM10027285_07120 [Oleiagrimonas citrea]